MSEFNRLRQIALVAPTLAPAVDAMKTVFGLDPCFRDPAVGKYGLENALFVFGSSFLEVVAPTREGTAAGRFLPACRSSGYSVSYHGIGTMDWAATWRSSTPVASSAIATTPNGWACR